MPRQTLDQEYEHAFADSRDLETWMRWNKETIERYVDAEGGFSTTMAVIRKRRIVNRQGRKPSLNSVKAAWVEIKGNPWIRPKAGEIAPGVRFIARRGTPTAPSVQSPTAPKTVVDQTMSPSLSTMSALELRNSRRPKMPDVVHRKK